MISTMLKKNLILLVIDKKKKDIIILDDVSDSFPEIKKFIEYLKNLNRYNIDIINSDKVRSYAICTKLND